MTEIKVIKNLVSTSKYNIKCPYVMTPKYITIHNTSNSAPAKNEVNYMIGNNNQVSFHYAIDDKEVIQGIPDNRNAWHCGDGSGEGNRASIGLEICYSTKKTGTEYTKAEKLAVKFTAQLLKKYKLTVDKVRTHKSWTEIGVKKGYSSYVKNCPHRILDEGRWNYFIKRVQAELDKLNGKKATVVKVSTPTVKPKATEKSIGVIVTKVKDLNFYNSPRWSKPSGTVPKNTVLTIVAKVKTEGVYQYKTITGNYITASTSYVTFKAK